MCVKYKMSAQINKTITLLENVLIKLAITVCKKRNPICFASNSIALSRWL